ncbi:hypothetical protein J4E91_004056 [Alternaria rosae]|nr:hypothetical protein J4E91_004056 [Alternaria rosae]
MSNSRHPKLRKDEDDNADSEGQEDEPEDVEEDYFAVDGNGRGCLVQDANEPIWDPRRYWLRIVELRVLRILEEWVEIIQFVEKGVEAWKDKRVRELLANHKSSDQPIIEQLFEETATTIQILGKLYRTIQKTIRVWTTFTAASGDYRYFSDLRDPASLSAFRNLKAAFRLLDDLQHKLKLLDKICQELQVIKRVNNRLSWQTQLRADHAHELNRQTNEISHKIHILNRRSTEAARETSRGTRVNVLVSR